MQRSASEVSGLSCVTGLHEKTQDFETRPFSHHYIKKVSLSFMQKNTKGTETKNRIIRCARKLFYQNGYSATSMRAISELAGTNIGLMNYYFRGKAEIGMLIYTDIRQAFDDFIAEYEPDLNAVDTFLFSCAVELYLALENEAFGRFYLELSPEPLFHEKVELIIIDFLMKYTAAKDSDQAFLSCLGIMSIKPALVKAACSENNTLTTDAIIRYYLEQQLHVLGMPSSHAEIIQGILKKYYYNLAEAFTPIMTKLLG